MTAIELYKFIERNDIEWHYATNEVREEDVMILPTILQINDFIKLLPISIFENGVVCVMKYGYFVYWMKDICEHCDIELSEVFDKSKDKLVYLRME